MRAHGPLPSIATAQQYRVTEPCSPHKRTGVRCADCADYDAITERILIVKLGAMGDVLRTTSCLAPLRSQYRGSHITWLTRANAVPFLKGNPGIDRVLSIDTNYLELLLAEEFDLAIGPDADPLPASIMALSHSDRKRGCIADRRGGVKPLNEAADGWWRLGLDDELKQANRRTYGEWLYAICGLQTPVARPSLPLSTDTAPRAVRRLQELRPGVSRWVCFNTGGSRRWEEKRWKPAHYLQLARLITADDPDVGIVLVGGPDETAFNRALLQADTILVDGGTDNCVIDFASLVAACEWMLTGDSLGYHVACAVGTPALCLVGPTSPWELDTYTDNCVVQAPLDCIGCYLPKCPLRTTCMDLLAGACVGCCARVG